LEAKIKFPVLFIIFPENELKDIMSEIIEFYTFIWIVKVFCCPTTWLQLTKEVEGLNIWGRMSTLIVDEQVV
jgi:hypothetical protein